MSTGVFRFPQQRAAEIATATVKAFLANTNVYIVWYAERGATRVAETAGKFKQARPTRRRGHKGIGNEWC